MNQPSLNNDHLWIESTFILFFIISNHDMAILDCWCLTASPLSGFGPAPLILLSGVPTGSSMMGLFSNSRHWIKIYMSQNLQTISTNLQNQKSNILSPRMCLGLQNFLCKPKKVENNHFKQLVLTICFQTGSSPGQTSVFLLLSGPKTCCSVVF